MRKLVICLLVFGLYAIQTVGHMNSDPAPGRSPGPPVALTTNAKHSVSAEEDIGDSYQATVINTNIGNNNNNNHNQNNFKNKNNNKIYSANDTGEEYRSKELEDHDENQDDGIVGDDNSDDETDATTNNTSVYGYEMPSNAEGNTNTAAVHSREESLNDSTKATTSSIFTKSQVEAIKTQLTKNQYNDNNNNDSNNNNNNNNNNEDEEEDLSIKTKLHSTTHNDNEDSEKMTKHKGRQNEPHENKQQIKQEDVETTQEQNKMQATNRFAAYTLYNPQKYNENSSTSSADSSSSKSTFTSSSSSSSSSSSASMTFSSCQTELDDFLHGAILIDALDNVIDGINATSEDSATTASSSSTTSSSPSSSQSVSSLPDLKIELQLEHDTFDATTAYGINCGLLYKVRLSTTLVAKAATGRTQSQFTFASETASSSSSQPSASMGETKVQNPPMHYTGDYYVETVSLLQSHERGTFVTETSGNKLPISWFASAQHYGGGAVNRQMQKTMSNTKAANNMSRAKARFSASQTDARNDYTSSVSGEETQSVSATENDNTETLDDMQNMDNVDNIPSTKQFFQEFVKQHNNAAFKPKRQLQQQQQHNDNSDADSTNINGNSYNADIMWQQQQQLQHKEEGGLSSPSSSMSYKKSLLSVVSGRATLNRNDFTTVTSAEEETASSSASSSLPPLPSSLFGSSSAATKRQKQRRSSGTDDENLNTCPDNKWQGTTTSRANAAGGISTESLSLWWINELCEQNDIVEFRVFFRLKVRKVNKSNNKDNNSKSNNNNNSNHKSNNNNNSGNNYWFNASGNNGHSGNEQKDSSGSTTTTDAAADTANVDDAQIVVYRKTFQFQIRKDCHLILRETSMGTLDYTVLPLYCIDCTVHFPNYKNLNTLDDSNSPPGILLELQRLNVPCASGGFIRFNNHKILCGKLEELEATDRVYHFNVGEDEDTSVQFYRNPMFSLSFKLVDYCYNISNSNESGEYYIRSSMKDHLECYFRIHLPYGNRVLLRMVTNNDSDILPMPRLRDEMGATRTGDDDVMGGEEMYTIFSSQGTTIEAQVINLTLNGGNNFGAYSPIMPLFKLPDYNYTTTSSRKFSHADMQKQKAFANLGLDSYGFLAATKANIQTAFSGTANCVGVVIKVFENDHSSKWSHCVNDTRHMRGFILESSSNTLSVHLFRSPATNTMTSLFHSDHRKSQMPAIYLSYQARPLINIVSNCAFGWIAMQQYCISAIDMAMTWHEGEQYCSKLGGHLVSIRNDQQQQTINEMLQKSPGYGDENAYWVGASDKSYEGDFRWSDGMTFQYTNWFPGWSQHGHYNKQPNDDGLSSQDCIELRRYFRTPPGVQTNRSPITSKFMWNDRDCSATNFLICERAMGDESMRRNWLNDCNKTVSLTKEHPRASIWSPSFPRQYPDNANCFTTITAPAGYRIVIEFEELVIENEPGCTYDYLEITEPKQAATQRYTTKTAAAAASSTRHRYAHGQDKASALRTFRKRSPSPYDMRTSTFVNGQENSGEQTFAPMNTDYNGYDLAQNNYQKLLEIYSSLYAPRDDIIIQTPDYPRGNPYYQNSMHHHHHQQHHLNAHNMHQQRHPSNINSNSINNDISQHHHQQQEKSSSSSAASSSGFSSSTSYDIMPKRLCGDWSTKLKLLRYVSSGSYLGLHFVSDYSHHFGGYKAKTYMENTASECSNERLKAYNGSCYLFVSYPEVDWWTAQQVCAAMGAKLTSVSSSDEHRFITSNIRNQIDYSPQLIYWLGAELEKNGQFEWTDDTKMSFQGWLPGQGQFDAQQPPPDGICLGLQWKMSPTPMLPSGLYWQSQKCTKVGGYVCKKPKESFGNFAFSNFTVTGTEGRLVSPAYPNTYPLNIDYWIHIKAPERTRIIVQFQKIDLEPQDECLYDFISIQDYDMVSKIVLEPGANTPLPMAMLMSAGEHITAYKGNIEDIRPRNGNGNDGYDITAEARRMALNDDPDNEDDEGNENDNENVDEDDNYNSSGENDDETEDNETTRVDVGHKQQQQQFQQLKVSNNKVRLRRSITNINSLYNGHTAKMQGHLQNKRKILKNIKTQKLNNNKNNKRIRQTTKTFLMSPQYETIPFDAKKEMQRQRKMFTMQSDRISRKHSTMKYDNRKKYYSIVKKNSQQQQQLRHSENAIKQQQKYDLAKSQDVKSSSSNNHHKRRKEKQTETPHTLRYRRSTILGDGSAPTYENAQSFLPYVRWCGFHESNMSKFDFVSKSNEVMMNFHSDYSTTGLGFATIWKAIDVSGCPLRTLTSREGIIASPNYPHFLLNNLNCAFVIQAPVGKRVWLEITAYDFQEDAMLEIDIGNGAFRPFQVTEHVNDGMFVSIREQLRVQYRTGQHPRGKGFQAIYHTVGQMEKRERIINLTSNDTGHLYQLNYPHDMPENVDFTQHLVAPFGHNILLELHDVEFAENGCPDNNIIEVYDNYADNNGTKWQLCKFQYANFHTGSPLDDNYFTTNMHVQQQQQPQQSDGNNNIFFLGGRFDISDSNDFPILNNDVVISSSSSGNSGGNSGGGVNGGHSETTSSWPSSSSTTTVAEFLLRQQQQQQAHYLSVPPPPPPVYITSYLNTLYVRQRTTAKAVANLNCTVTLQWDNNYKIKLASGDKSVESCQPNPCQFDGKCVMNNGTSYCQCLGHYTGRFCGLNVCELDPCVFGRCELTATNFKCQCQPGYMGTTCEQKTRPCAENPCEGRGICIEKNGGFFCRCYAWWEGHRCEKRMLHIPYKPLSERMLQEPFWLGLITVFVVLAVIGLVWCAKRHFPEKIEKLLAEEADRNRPPGSVHGHHHHTSLREQLQFTTAIPQSTVNNAPGAPRSIFNRLGIRKPSLLSLSSPNPIPGGGGAAARTFSLDDLLRPPPRRSPSPRKKRNNSTPVKKNAAEKKQILQQLVSPAANAAKPKLNMGELISLSENRVRAAASAAAAASGGTMDSESDMKETTFSENTGSQTSATVERTINDPKLEKKVTFARLLNKVSAEMSSGSEVDIGTMAATRNSSALSLPTDIQLRASSMPPSPCTNDMRSPHSTSSNHGSDSFSSSDLALTDFGLRSIQTSGSDVASTHNHQLSGLPLGMPARCRLGSPARPKVSSADSILAMFRNFANNSNITSAPIPSSASVFVSPCTTPTVSSPQDDAGADDESSTTSSMHTPVSFSSGPPDSPVFYRQTTIEVPVLDVLNAHKSTSSSSSTTSSTGNLLHPPTILLEIPSSGINNKCLSPIREMPTPIPSPALTPIMPRPQRTNSPIFQEDPLSGGDYSDDDDAKSDRSDAQLSEKLRIGLQREKDRRHLDSDVETAPTDTTTTSMANLNKPMNVAITSKTSAANAAPVVRINHKLPMLSITPATNAAAANMQMLAPPQMPTITIDIEPPTPEEKQPRPRDLIIPTLTVEQPSPTKNRHPMIIFPGSPPPQRASIGETSFMFPNKQQQKRLLKQFEKPTSLDFPFAPPMITVTSNMSELESDTEPLSPAPKTGVTGGLMPPNPVGMCYLSPFTMCTRADRTISESNLSSSGYSSMASPGPSRCGSSNPLYPNEMDEPGSGHSGPGLSLHVNLLNRRKSSVLPSCKENITNGKCTTEATGGAKTDRLQSHRPRSDSETFSDDILIESNDEGIGTDHVDEKLDDTRLSSRRFDMFLDDEVLIEVDEPPPCTQPSTTLLLGGNTTLTPSCAPQMAQLQLPSIVIQIDGSGDKTLSPVSSRSESPLSERAGIGRFSPHFYGRKDQLPFTDSDGLYDFPSSDGKGASMQSFSHQRRSSSKKRDRKASKCSATQSPTKLQLDVPSKESLNTSSTPSSSSHICNKHCHSHHHPCPAVNTVPTRKSPKRRQLNRHAVASSSSSSESLNSTKELTVRPLPRRLNSPNREKRPRKQESLSEDEVADSILRRISPSIVKEEEPPKPKCKINRLRAIGIQIRFLRRLEKSIKTRERIVSPSDSCPEEDNITDDMDSPQASSPLLQPPSPSKTRLALCRQKRLPIGTYGITTAEMNTSQWKGMDRSLIGDDLLSD